MYAAPRVKQSHRSAVYALMILVTLGFTNTIRAANPEIHAAWSQPTGPYLNVHYQVITSAPASPEYPDVRLLIGDLGWKVWSTDIDNPGSIGDIGVISTPVAANFAVKVETDTGGAGA